MKKEKIVWKGQEKDRKKYYSSFRGSWNGVKPVTRIIENKKKAFLHKNKGGD